MHHLYTISIFSFPTPNRTHTFWRAWSVKHLPKGIQKFLTPNFYQSRKRLSLRLQHIHLPKWLAGAMPWWCSCSLTNVMMATIKHLPPCLLLWETVTTLFIHWQQSLVVKVACADPCINSPIFSQLCSTSLQENQQHFSLPTSLKHQSTQDSSQNMNIPRHTFDITGLVQGESNVWYSLPRKNYVDFTTWLKRVFIIGRHL